MPFPRTSNTSQRAAGGHSHLGVCRCQLDLLQHLVPDLGGLEAEEAEVVERVAVERRESNLLLGQEHRVGGDRSVRDDVAIGEDDAPARVHDEAGGMAEACVAAVVGTHACTPHYHDGT
jgi:hypothetical protein